MYGYKLYDVLYYLSTAHVLGFDVYAQWIDDIWLDLYSWQDCSLSVRNVSERTSHQLILVQRHVHPFYDW